MALAPYSVIGGGKLRTDAEEEKRAASGENGRSLFGDWRRNENETKMSHALEKVANEIGAKNITSGKQDHRHIFTFLVKLEPLVAIAYVMHKAPYVFPLVGGRKVEHLLDNIEALKISLSEEQILYLESIVPFDIGFPNNIFVSQKIATSFFYLISELFNSRVTAPTTVFPGRPLQIWTGARDCNPSAHRETHSSRINNHDDGARKRNIVHVTSLVVFK